MTHTAEQFARARFATHPDGRIAARLDDDGFPWVGSGEAFRDAEMPAEGFVPLSESLPSTPTAEMLDRAETAAKWAPTNLTHRGIIEHILTAALSAAPAPTTDEGTLGWREHPRYDEATARDLLNAAWDAAHVPADGIIPARTPFLFRTKHGTDRRVSMSTGAPDDLPTDSVAGERRLLDPPTPKRPEGAKAVEALLREMPPGAVAETADWLIEHGVRVTEDGEGER